MGKCLNAYQQKAGCTIKCLDGGIGRRAGLKHQYLHGYAGSTPARGTNEKIGKKLKET